MSKRSDKVLKHKQKRIAHEKYLKYLFAKHGHSLRLNSNREAPGNKYYDALAALKSNSVN